MDVLFIQRFVSSMKLSVKDTNRTNVVPSNQREAIYCLSVGRETDFVQSCRSFTIFVPLVCGMNLVFNSS